MRQSRSYGSVRGVRGNSHPYRDIDFRGLSFSQEHGLLDRRQKSIVCPTSDVPTLDSELLRSPGQFLDIRSPETSLSISDVDLGAGLWADGLESRHRVPRQLQKRLRTAVALIASRYRLTGGA